MELALLLSLPNLVNINPLVGTENLMPLSIGIGSNFITVPYLGCIGLHILEIFWNTSKFINAGCHMISSYIWNSSLLIETAFLYGIGNSSEIYSSRRSRSWWYILLVGICWCNANFVWSENSSIKHLLFCRLGLSLHIINGTKHYPCQPGIGLLGLPVA